MKKSIGIDIDDTLIKVWSQDIIDNYNNKYNKNLIFDEIITHDFIGDDKLKKEFFDYFYSNYMSFDLYPGCYDKLKELKENYDLYLITSRPDSDIKITHEYINNKFGKGFFKDIIFSHKHNDYKCSLAIKYNFDIVIDDAPHHINNYYFNTKINNIIIFDNPWNRKLNFNDRVTRVKSWEEIKLK